MPLENNVADLPPFDPKADRGDTFEPTTDNTVATVELTADEIKEVIPAKEPAKAEAEKAPAAEEKPATEEAAKPEDKPREKDGTFAKKDVMIPKARFDEVNNKAKARIQELERQLASVAGKAGVVDGKLPDTSALEAALDAKGLEYGKLLADGETEKANAVFKEISSLNRQIATAEIKLLTGGQVQEQAHVSTLGQLVDMYKQAFTVFDSGSPDYNQGYVDYVANLQGKFERAGNSPAEALREAVEIAVDKFKLDAEEAPAPAKEDKAADRKAKAVDKAIDAAKAQPASLEKLGLDSDKAGTTKISLDQIKDYGTFNRISESALQRLRGDFL